MRKKERVVDFVAEAEKIIHNYIRKDGSFKTGTDTEVAYLSASEEPVKHPMFIQKGKFGKSKFGDFVLNIIMAIGCLIIAAILMWGLLG